MPRKPPGGPRDSVLSVRVPARLKFGLELVSRLHREPITDSLVRAVNDSLTSENGGLVVELPGEEMPTYLLPKVWDERESVRLVKLALVYPALLSRSEQLVWEAIEADDRYWSSTAAESGKKARTPTSPRRMEDLQVEVLESNWGALKAAANSLM